MIKIAVFLILNILFGLFLMINNGYSMNNKSSVAQSKLQNIDFVYYDRFPYKKIYNEITMPECTRISAGKQQKAGNVLLCKEHITLLRSASIIKLWQHQQRLKGYIPFSMKEFGIINVHAHITGVKEYIPVMKNTITPDSNHVTGKFIRYAPEVNRYTVKDKQTNMTSAFDATPNHPFYVINKHAFVPISEVLSSDSLVTLSNHEAHLTYPDNNYLYSINRKKNKLIRVYNVEVEKKHVYFVSKLNILAHNECKRLTEYYRYLKIRNIIQVFYIGDKPSLSIQLPRADLYLLKNVGLFPLMRELFNNAGGIQSSMLTDIHNLGFGLLEGHGLSSLEEEGRLNVQAFNEQAALTWKLREPMSMTDYEEKFLKNIPDYDKPSQVMEVSSTTPDLLFAEQKIEEGVSNYEEATPGLSTAATADMAALKEASPLKRGMTDRRESRRVLRSNRVGKLRKK